MGAAPGAPATAGADEIPGAGVVAVGAIANIASGLADVTGTAFQWAGGTGIRNFAISLTTFAVSFGQGEFLRRAIWSRIAKTSTQTSYDAVNLAISNTNGVCGAE